MKAIIYYDCGPPEVLKCEEIDQSAAGDSEVLIKVRAAAVNPLDWRLMRGGPYILRKLSGLGKPKMKRPGVDVAGQVVAVGTKVTQFSPGDEVFGTCRGAFAEYACAPSKALALKPRNASFEQAAAVPIAGLTALQGLRDKGKIQPGQKVLINGAAGGVGAFAVQIAKSFGAEVTGVCSTPKVNMVRSIGADRVVDYTREDFTQGTERYDLILDNVGNLSFASCRRVLSAHGRCVIVGAQSVSTFLLRALAAPVLSPFASKKFVVFIAKSNTDDLRAIGDLIEAGKVTPAIDRRYNLNEVPEALRYLEQGHARGKVVITVG
jgi:NADPH:quinone reductase-like Zn-dependent oxidoreductase